MNDWSFAEAASAGLRLLRASGRELLVEGTGRREGLAAGFPFAEWPLRRVLDADGLAFCRPFDPLPVREWPFELKRAPLGELLPVWGARRCCGRSRFRF